jgi:flagellar hook-associated protein 1 FlgK
MGTINAALSLISQALDADQAGLNVISNNVANASTTGYTEEKSAFKENSSINIDGVQYGTGATQVGPVSQRDKVLEQRLNQQQQLASASSSRLTALETLQSTFSTSTSTSSSTSAGSIGTDLTDFFDSFSSLEASPTSNSLRQEVLTSAKTLSGDVSSAALSLESQKSELDQQAASVTTQVNALTTDLAKVNQEIQSQSSDSDAGTLEDQRQEYLSELSKLIGINQVTTEDNGISVTTTDGQLLVSGGNSVTLTMGTVSGVTHFFLGSNDVTDDLTSGGGELGGLLTVRDQDIPSATASLDQLAYSVSTQVNTLNNAGTDLNGNTSDAGNIFNEPTEVSGSSLAMSVVMTDPNSIAAASSSEGTGDSSNAEAMAALASSTIVDGATPENYYSNFVTSLGSTVSSVESENTAEEASVTQLQSQVDSISGVNLNDEASALTVLERSYEAASQVFSILNEMMASAINLGEETTVS